jgi:hypothetical protein
MDAATSGDRNVIKKEAKKILKHKDLTTVTQCMWNVKKKSDTHNWHNWNHLKINQNIHQPHTRKA